MLDKHSPMMVYHSIPDPYWIGHKDYNDQLYNPPIVTTSHASSL